jgi:hypothetical protein
VKSVTWQSKSSTISNMLLYPKRILDSSSHWLITFNLPRTTSPASLRHSCAMRHMDARSSALSLRGQIWSVQSRSSSSAQQVAHPLVKWPWCFICAGWSPIKNASLTTDDRHSLSANCITLGTASGRIWPSTSTPMASWWTSRIRRLIFASLSPAALAADAE